MSQQFEVDTDGLTRAQAPFRDLASRLSQLSQQTQSRVSALGNVWGDDSAGASFASTYAPARNQLLESLSSTADVADSTADGVATMGRGFARTEQDNIEASESLLTRMRGDGIAPSGEPVTARDLRGRVATTSYNSHADPVGPIPRTQHVTTTVPATQPVTNTPLEPGLGIPVRPGVGTPGIPAVAANTATYDSLADPVGPIPRTQHVTATVPAAQPLTTTVPATQPLTTTVPATQPLTATVPATQPVTNTPLEPGLGIPVRPGVGTPGIPATVNDDRR